MANEKIKLIQRIRAMCGVTIVVGAMMLFVPTASVQGAASTPDKVNIEAGENVYNNNCQNCHGDRLVNTGQTFDLRRLTAGDRTRFDNSVRNGKNQMPPWKDVLSDEEVDQVWHYIRANAFQK